MQDFWNNISRYPRFFITIIFGVIWNFIEPLMPLLKRPSTAIALVGAFVAALAFVGFTLRAMLGLNAV